MAEVSVLLAEVSMTFGQPVRTEVSTALGRGVCLPAIYMEAPMILTISRMVINFMTSACVPGTIQYTYLFTYCPLCLLACRAATKALYWWRFLVILSMVPQV